MKAKEQRFESLYTDGASTVVVAFGSTSRIALDALMRA
ncbi:MAG: 3-methyl-2-oxobutanoate dehydrogenase subunit beta, partial [Deltaproteobacteria bacterium]|nr:3-methyl-2-oxobutanoate dehydrogenase subunit beta [Deltaproteobacteria bacterium]